MDSNSCHMTPRFSYSTNYITQKNLFLIIASGGKREAMIFLPIQGFGIKTLSVYSENFNV